MQDLPGTAPPKAGSKGRRWARITLVGVAVLALLIGAWRTALHRLETRVRDALGPDAALQDVSIGWPGIVVVDRLRLKGPKGWPAKETLRAERVEVVPALRSLFSERVVIEKVRIDGVYLSVLRNKQGKLKLLPSVFDKKDQPTKPDSERRRITIDEVELDDATVDLYDASVQDELVNLKLVNVQADLEDLRIPERDAHTKLAVNGTVKGGDDEDGKAGDGRFSVKGWLEVASRESDLVIKLEDVDLKPLEPYLLRRSETGVKRGRMSLDVHSKVRNRQLDAPGTLVLKDLKLKPAEGIARTFMGVPRSAVLLSLKSSEDTITLHFTLSGDLGDTQFSLNETLPVRVTVGMAQSLGVGLVDIVKDVGSFGGGALEATGEAIGKLFGGGKSDDEDEDAGTAKREASRDEPEKRNTD